MDGGEGYDGNGEDCVEDNCYGGRDDGGLAGGKGDGEGGVEDGDVGGCESGDESHDTGCSKSKVPKVRHCCTHGYAFIWSFIGANYSQTWSILCRSTSV